MGNNVGNPGRNLGRPHPLAGQGGLRLRFSVPLPADAPRHLRRILLEVALRRVLHIPQRHVRGGVERGATETVLASTTFTTTHMYELKTATLTGPDPDAQAGDILLLRVVIIAQVWGLPCVVELDGPGTDNFIEVPETSVETD